MQNDKNYPRECPILRLSNKATQAVLPVYGRASPVVYSLWEIDESIDREFRRTQVETEDTPNQWQFEQEVQSHHPPACISQGGWETVGSSGLSSGSCYSVDAGTLLDICNYYPILVTHTIFLNQKGDPDDEQEEIFTLKIVNSSSGAVLCKDISLRKSELKRAATIIGDKAAGAMMYPNMKNAGKLVENTIRSQVSDVPTTYKISQAGWNLFQGKHFFASQEYRHDGVEIETSYTLPTYPASKRDLIEVVEKMLAIYGERDSSRVMFLYALTGVMFSLFEEAGYKIRFLLFILGKSGSFKTSLTKVFYVQLCKEEYRDTPRQIGIDTGVSFERALAKEGKDTVLPFDDYNPPKTNSAEQTLKNNVESIIRMVGDGATKSRSNKALDNLRGTGVHGTVVITGEIMASGISSNLRCLYVNIEGSLVDKDILSEFQRKKYAVCTLIRHFADYLSERWEPAVEYIREHFDAYRNDPLIASMLINKRLVDCYATLQIIADICKDFLKDYCGMEDHKVELLFKGMREGVATTVHASETATEESDPALEFMRAFVSLVEVGQFKLKEGRLSEEELGRLDGFFDDKYIYVLESNFYEKTDRWLSMTRLSSQMNLREVERLLHKEGYLMASPNGSSKITYCCRVKIGKLPGKINFVKFYRDKVQSIRGGENVNS